MYTPHDDHLRSNKSVKLEEEISRYMEKLLPAQTRPGFELQHAWEKITSPETRKHTDTVMFSKRSKEAAGKETVIVVYVDDSSWAAELTMQKEYYRFMLEKELARPIVEVRFYASRITALRKN